MKQSGNASLLALLEHRATGITTHAYCNIGLKVLKNLLCKFHATAQIHEHFHVTKQVLAVETSHWQAFDFIARSRHSLHLHASLGSNKEELSLRHATLNFVGYR